MTIYIIILALLLLLVLFSSTKVIVGQVNINFSNITIFLLFILLFAIAGFRYGIGTDYKVYSQAFELFSVNINPSWMNFEPGFILLNKLLIKITDNAQVLIAITSLLVLVPFFKACKKNSSDIIFSIFLFYTLYFYFSSFNIIRQYIAVMIAFLGTKDLLNKDAKNYFIKIAIASLFHSTALIMVPFYFIAEKQARLRVYIAGTVIAVACAFFYNQITTLFVQVFTKYAVYINYHSGGAAFNILFLIINLILLLLALNRKAQPIEIDERRKFNLYSNACFLGLLFSALSPLNILFSRVAIYFFIYSTISIPFCLKYFKRNDRAILKCGVCLLASFICFYYLCNNIAGVVPYESIIM